MSPRHGEDTALRLACFSSPQERVHPDPAGLKLPFNQLCFPELLHPVNPPAITITAIKGGISCSTANCHPGGLTTGPAPPPAHSAGPQDPRDGGDGVPTRVLLLLSGSSHWVLAHWGHKVRWGHSRQQFHAELTASPHPAGPKLRSPSSLLGAGLVCTDDAHRASHGSSRFPFTDPALEIPAP